MKKTLITAAIIGSIFFSYNNANAQDVRFTQFYAMPLLLNPAIMGANNNLNVGLCYRSQWGSVNSGYSNYAFNGMYPLKLAANEGKLDVGLSLMGGKAGAFGMFNAMIAVDYNKEIAEDNSLCLALIGGYGQQSLTTSGLTFDNQYVQGAYNPNANSNENILSQKAGYADVGFGFTWYYNPSSDKSKINAFVGISGFHLNQPNISMTGSTSKLPARMSYQAGIKIFEAKNIDIVPNAYVLVQNGNIETALGLYGNYDINDQIKATLGFWYRRNDAIAILVGFAYKGFTLGYSYDAVTSTISSNISGGINANEITLSYNLAGSGGASQPSFGGGAASSNSATPANPSPFPQF
jgi:type IX secretion system PorP/SprF family membrane protein